MVKSLAQIVLGLAVVGFAFGNLLLSNQVRTAQTQTEEAITGWNEAIDGWNEANDASETTMALLKACVDAYKTP